MLLERKLVTSLSKSRMDFVQRYKNVKKLVNSHEGHTTVHMLCSTWPLGPVIVGKKKMASARHLTVLLNTLCFLYINSRAT